MQIRLAENIRALRRQHRFTQEQLAEALGVARPTLDRWIANGWLEPCRVQISSSGDTLFAANAVREVLERFR